MRELARQRLKEFAQQKLFVYKFEKNCYNHLGNEVLPRGYPLNR